MKAPTDSQAQAAHCWFKVDRVAREPDTTAWKCSARWRQAQWRESRGYPVGTEPYEGGPNATIVGSRLALDFARASGANFLTPSALHAARHRIEHKEPHEMLSARRLWADLLSSMPLCFNLFATASPEEAARRLRAWWPSAPSGIVTTRFEHSPARTDPLFLGNRSAFDVAFGIETAESGSAILGIETKYHENAVREKVPGGAALRRYAEVTERSRAFAGGWEEKILGTELQQIWLDHLLVLSMLQHESNKWAWGKFVLVYPRANPSFARATAKYEALLVDSATFEARTIDELVDTPDALDPAMAVAFRERYLADGR